MEEKKQIANMLLLKAKQLDSITDYPIIAVNTKQRGKRINIEKEKEKLMRQAVYEDKLAEFKNYQESRNEWINIDYDDKYINTIENEPPTYMMKDRDFVNYTSRSNKYSQSDYDSYEYSKKYYDKNKSIIFSTKN